ncbi:interactor of HORMAD1 protein 1 [Sphaeramia orbicularis]|uniref:interactor of HORMAD1 protein 1 n=1 Tax=Sphaeramia orbicularis TaxID=375764 RepID=UPI00117C3F7A|nr:interactor of HORMAD1 protein 1 [Sphaeramia orbicularis]
MNRMRSITEMLSIPTGNSNRNAGTSGYSSLTDSQFFFGSQFWPENSQGTSQDVSLSSRTSQQSSQEESDPTFANSYLNKPLLFGEAKDKSKPFSILHTFEEDKRKAKENADSQVLVKERLQFREALENIQQLVTGTEKNTAVCHTVLEKLNDFASALQKHLNSHQSDTSQQFETLLIKVNSQLDTVREIRERMQKTEDTSTELGLNVQSIKTSLECLRNDQERDRNMLEEALKLLSTLVSKDSAKLSPATVMDSVIQTSPMLEQPVSSVLQENKLEGTRLNDICGSYKREHNQVGVPPQDPKGFVGKRKSSLRRTRRGKKKPLVLSQRCKNTIPDENCQSLINCNKQPNISAPLCERHDLSRITSRENVRPDCQTLLNREPRYSEAAACIITPLCCWSQDSNSSAGIEVEPILDKLSAESNTETSVKPGSLWQLFDMEGDVVDL